MKKSIFIIASLVLMCLSTLSYGYSLHAYDCPNCSGGTSNYARINVTSAVLRYTIDAFAYEYGYASASITIVNYDCPPYHGYVGYGSLTNRAEDGIEYKSASGRFSVIKGYDVYVRAKVEYMAYPTWHDSYANYVHLVAGW